jgi:hypothetical protein
MARELQEWARTGVSPDELRQLLGPPLLSTKGGRSNGEIMGRLMHCLAPHDFMGQLLVKEMTDCTWETVRYIRRSGVHTQ